MKWMKTDVEEIKWCMAMLEHRGHANVGQSTGAVASYLKCQAVDPNPAVVAAYLGAALLVEAGRWDDARELLGTLLEVVTR